MRGSMMAIWLRTWAYYVGRISNQTKHKTWVHAAAAVSYLDVVEVEVHSCVGWSRGEKRVALHVRVRAYSSCASSRLDDVKCHSIHIIMYHVHTHVECMRTQISQFCTYSLFGPQRKYTHTYRRRRRRCRRRINVCAHERTRARAAQQCTCPLLVILGHLCVWMSRIIYLCASSVCVCVLLCVAHSRQQGRFCLECGVCDVRARFACTLSG